MSDPVNHPAHYQAGGLEAIQVIRAFEMNFNLGNAFKYIARAGRKSKEKEIEDLKKAIWYIQDHINHLSSLPKDEV